MQTRPGVDRPGTGATASSSDDDRERPRVDERAVAARAAGRVFSPAAPAPVSLPGGPFLQCLVTPKLPFSVPRDASWTRAADVPREVLLAGFRRRFPASLGGLDGLRFEAVSRRALGELPAGAPAIFRLASDDEAEDRVLVRVLAELERGYESAHRVALERARTDMLSSSMTFQVMADEIHARQGEDRTKFEKAAASLRSTLASTSKRLFLLEQEKGTLAASAHAANASNAALKRCVERLGEENVGLRSRTAALEARLDAFFFADDARSVAARGPPPPAASPVPRPTADGGTQTELVVVAVGVAEAKGPSRG